MGCLVVDDEARDFGAEDGGVGRVCLAAVGS